MEAAPEFDPPRWRAWTAFAALVAGLAATLLLGSIVSVIVTAIAGGHIAHPPPGATLAATLVQDACLVAAAVGFAWMAGRPSPEALGLRAPRLGRALGALVLAGVSFYLFLATWVAVLHVTQKDKLPTELGADRSALSFAGVAVLVCVVAPIAEELFFRGFFFPALATWLGWPGAAVLTGVVFGAIHAGSAPAPLLVPLAFFGLVLCLLYRRTGSLYPCIALHALNNSLALGASEGWGWQVPLLMAAALAAIAAVVLPVARLGTRHLSPA